LYGRQLLERDMQEQISKAKTNKIMNKPEENTLAEKYSVIEEKFELTKNDGNMTEDEIITCEGHLECGAPSKLIYNFEGTLNLTNGEKEPLNLENTMWASTVLASQKIIGIVIYTGKESRARMNSSNPKLKMAIKYMLCIMIHINIYF